MLIAHRNGMMVSSNKEDKMFKELYEALVQGTVTEIGSNYNVGITTLRDCAFYRCPLTSISLPSATALGQQVFYQCSNLATIELPVALTTGTNCIALCSGLVSISVPNLQVVGNQCFSGCSRLPQISLPSCTTIYNYAFFNCTDLKLLDFRGVSAVPTLESYQAFTVDADRKIVVPDALYSEWITKSQWSNERVVGGIIRASDYEASL